MKFLLYRAIKSTEVIVNLYCGGDKLMFIGVTNDPSQGSDNR